MTRTGYSCAFMRRKNKHGCSAAVWHWCSEICRIIDPMTCHHDCPKFAALADKYRRPKTMGVELL
jgi:hypothetical protein